MNKYLPVILFAICIAIALILAWSFRPFWPAALAIAISGAALALSLRLQSHGAETTELIDEIVALQQSDAELRSDLATTRSMIDELADVVEQLASVAAEGNAAEARDQIEAVRAEVATLASETETRFSTLAETTDTGTEDRLGAMEARLSAIAARRPAEAQAPAEVAAAPTEDVRALMARANGREDSAPDATEPDAEPSTHSNHASETKVSLTPIFTPNLGTPVAFVLSPNRAEAVDDIPAILAHAEKIAGELEGAKKDVRLFLKLSARSLGHLTVRRDILASIDRSTALQRRLTMLTPQTGFDAPASNTLAAIAEHGCKFALDHVRDWSINLASLSRNGLGFIVVDGMAMARSAEEQGGDPRRLAQALGAHGIDLIAGGVMVREDIETVRALEPALVMGDGLGIPRILDAPA